jgi:putative inorganic carbon (HCO3(-)) transporter
VILGHTGQTHQVTERSAGLLTYLSTWLLPSLAVLVPLASGPMLADKFELPKVLVLKLALALVLAACAIRGAIDIGSLRVPAVRAALLFLGITALASIASIEPRTSIVGAFDEDKGLLTHTLMIACFLMAASWVQTVGDLARLTVGLSLGAALISVYGIIQQVTVDPIAWAAVIADGRRVTATLGYPNSVGEYLAMSILLTAWLAWRARGVGRGLAFGALVLQLVALWLSQSRAAWLVVFAQAIMVGPLILCARWRSGRWPGTVISLAPVAASLTIVALLQVVPAPRWPSDDPILSRFGGYRGSPLETRQALWQSSTAMIADRPLLGWGPDTFLLAYPTHRSVELDSQTNHVGRDDNPHNVFLLTAVNSGLLGLAAYIAAHAAVVVLLVNAAFRRSDALDARVRGAAIALLMSLLSYHTLFLFGRNRIATDWFSWMLAGAALGLFVPRSHVLFRLGGIRRVVPLMLAVGLLFEGGSGLLADWSFESGLQSRVDAPARALDSFRRAVVFRPFEPAYRQGLGLQLLQMARFNADGALFHQAANEFATASALSSHRDAYALMRLAQAQVERDSSEGRVSDLPLDYARRAIALDLQNPLLYILAADLASQVNRPGLADDYIAAGRARAHSADARALLDQLAARLRN